MKRTGGDSLDRLGITLSGLDTAIITADAGHRLTYLSPAARSLTGWTQEAAAGLPLETILKLVDPETRRPIESLHAVTTSDGASPARHALLIAKDGSENPIDYSVSIPPDSDAGGELVLVFRKVVLAAATGKTLKQGQMDFRLLVEEVTDYAIFLLDTQGYITTWNAGAERIKGYRAEEILGSHFSRFYPKEAIETGWPDTELRIATAEGRFEEEGWRLRKDGTRFWANVVITALHDRTGALQGFSKITRDLTEHKRAERELAESEQRFRLLVEEVQEYAIILLDPQGLITTWNAGAERINGYRAAEIIGRHFSCFYPKEAIDSGWPETELRTAMVDGRFEDEGWRLRKDGTRFWANVILTPMRDKSGNLKGFSKITRDLTERRLAEIALRDRDARYRRIFESAKDGLLLLDESTGKIIDANPSLEKMSGLSRDELLGKDIWQAGLLENSESTRAAFETLRQRGSVRFDNQQLVSHSGRLVDIEFIGSVYVVDTHRIIHCNFRDISDRRQLERAKVEAEVLADLNRRKDEFLAMLSHELRNPLAPIMNAVQLLRIEHGTENPLQQQARTIIERQVFHLTYLVDDLLEVSRITTGRIRLHEEDLDLRGVVERAVDSVRPLIDKRRHQLAMVLPPDPVWVHGDPTRLEQVAANLLNNAAKYTEEGGRIEVGVQQEDGKAALRITDNGVGISPELLPRIFDLFTQADRSLDRSQGGLGIGLTLVRGLVELHRGTVEVSSRLGEGSRFVVRLPLLPAPSSRPRPAPGSSADTEASPLRVLVVDDNIDQADSLAMLLRLSGHDVQAAYSSQEALNTVSSDRPDVVLMDIGLPEMDGYEVARRIRKDSRLEHVKLIAMTGYGQESDRRRSREAGFYHHLVKPADPQKLKELLASLPRKRRNAG